MEDVADLEPFQYWSGGAVVVPVSVAGTVRREFVDRCPEEARCNLGFMLSSVHLNVRLLLFTA